MTTNLKGPHMSDAPSAFPFEHKNNIRIGNGRVLWGTSTTDTSGIIHSPGWVLPGGVRTADGMLARRVALEIDRLVSEG